MLITSMNIENISKFSNDLVNFSLDFDYIIIYVLSD